MLSFNHTEKGDSMYLSLIRLLFSAIIIFSAVAIPQYTHALTTGAVSLTFDDGLISQYQYAAPILKDGAQTATLFIPTGLIGTSGYMTWDNVARMVIDGWEMGGHSVSHAELPTLTAEEFQYEIEESFSALVRNGLIPVSFATPYGAYSPEIIASIATYFESHRGFHEIGFNRWPFNEYLLHVQQVTNQTTLLEVEGWIQEAIANNDWLIIVFHGIQPTVLPEETYVWSTENLQALMSYLNVNGIKTKTIAEMLNMKASMLSNSDFEYGIAEGWTTDNPTMTIADSNNHGATPNATSSIRMTGGDVVSNLLSPTVPLSADISEYGIRVFVNSIEFTSGEFGFYIDEYDIDGIWISSKVLGIGGPQFVVDESYRYIPTSELVASVGVRAYMNPGSVGNLYLDNFIFFENGDGPALPIPSPIVSIPLPNTTFDNGLSIGWTTDQSEKVVADTSNRGTSPTPETSIAFVGGDNPAHMFSLRSFVGFGVPYTVSAHIDTTDLNSGELGFYMDEYDINGDWISGRWLGMAENDTFANLSFPYSPTSSGVSSASIQTYLTSGAEGSAYVDNVELQYMTPPLAPEMLLNPMGTIVEDGIVNGWKTDYSQYVTPATTEEDIPVVAVSFLGTNTDVHLFSPFIIFNPEKKYLIEIDADITELSSGELGFYMDEYDALGNWISGQWIGMAEGEDNRIFRYEYKASQGVAYTSFQIYMTEHATGVAYIKNISIFLDTTPVYETTTLPIPNASFDEGLSLGWKTDHISNVLADNSGKGTDPSVETSVMLNGTTTNIHLFSPHVFVDALSAYLVSIYSNTTDLNSGELGFYMDEYDINGDWISGRWLGMAENDTFANLSFPYSPTSSGVSSASIQTYLTSGAEGSAYVDNVQILIPGL